jgi:hypothetical protein
VGEVQTRNKDGTDGNGQKVPQRKGYSVLSADISGIYKVKTDKKYLKQK